MGMANLNGNAIQITDNPDRNRNETLPDVFNLVDNAGNNLLDNDTNQLVSDVE